MTDGRCSIRDGSIAIEMYLELLGEKFPDSGKPSKQAAVEFANCPVVSSPSLTFWAHEPVEASAQFHPFALIDVAGDIGRAGTRSIMDFRHFVLAHELQVFLLEVIEVGKYRRKGRLWHSKPGSQSSPVLIQRNGGYPTAAHIRVVRPPQDKIREGAVKVSALHGCTKNQVMVSPGMVGA